MPPTPPIPADWLAEFEAATRRPLAHRWKYAFIKTYKPVLDDAPYRSFEVSPVVRRAPPKLARIRKGLNGRHVEEYRQAKPKSFATIHKDGSPKRQRRE